MTHLKERQRDDIQQTRNINRPSYGVIVCFRQSGYLAIGPYKGEFLEDNANSLRRNNAEFQYLNPDEMRRCYPMLSYPDNYGGIVDKDGGILRADKALRAYQVF